MKFMLNKRTAQYHKKKNFKYTAISLVIAFAVLIYLILPTNGIFAYVPTTPEESGCNPETDTDCFPDDIFTSDDTNNAQLSVLNGQFLSANKVGDESEVIEMDEIVVKGCKGGTNGEVPGKPGVCKE